MRLMKEVIIKKSTNTMSSKKCTIFKIEMPKAAIIQFMRLINAFFCWLMLKIGKSNAVIKQIKINKIPSITNKIPR